MPPSFGRRLAIERVEEVRIARLETLWDRCVEGIDEPRVFLKMDTQGFDRVVLAGAGAKLKDVLGLQTELAARPIYKGLTTGLTESISALEGLGFTLSGFYPVSFDGTDKVRVVEFDCLMWRS
jgi:hypothetical protein